MPNIRKHVEAEIFLSLTGKKGKLFEFFLSSPHTLLLLELLSAPYACMCLTRIFFSLNDDDDDVGDGGSKNFV